MGNYRRKPVEVDAMPVGEIIALATTDWDSLPQWIKDEYVKGNLIFGSVYLIINGGEVANPGGYLVYENGKLCPCDQTGFDAIYEPVVTGG
jgi:hypothetical protein